MPDTTDKAGLRKHYRARRSAITGEQRDARSETIARLLMAIERFEHAGSEDSSP